MKRTVRDYDLEATQYLLSRSDLDFTRREEGQTVQFVICQDGVELGRLTFSPVRPGFGGEVNITEDSTAIGRGAHISMQEYGTVVNIPDDERERHREFVAICKRIKSKVEFLHSARERHRSLTQDAKEGAGGAGKALGTQGGTLERVKTARGLIEEKVPKTTACKRAHTDPRTYDRYVAEIIDWGETLPDS